MSKFGVIDETLLGPRAVVRWRDCTDGLGFDVDLSCGHAVWTAITPAYATPWYCGMCLDKLINQARAVQSEQRPAG